MVGLAEGLEHRLLVKRHQGPGVDDLHADALLRQRLRGFQGTAHHQTHGDDRHIRAGPLHIRYADGDGVIALWHLALGLVELLVLAEQDGVVGADGAFQ